MGKFSNRVECPKCGTDRLTLVLQTGDYKCPYCVIRIDRRGNEVKEKESR